MAHFDRCVVVGFNPSEKKLPHIGSYQRVRGENTPPKKKYKKHHIPRVQMTGIFLKVNPEIKQRDLNPEIKRRGPIWVSGSCITG